MKSKNRREFLKLAALMPAASVAAHLTGQPSPVPQAAKPNIILIVFDTLSAKHMSLYGYPRSTTPNLRRFAKHATVFHNHHAGGNFTSPGTATLLTGAYTWTQRGFNFMATTSDEYMHRNLFRVLGDAGYYSVAYTHNWLAAELLNEFRSDIHFWKPTRDLVLVDSEVSDRFFPNDHQVALATERTTQQGGDYGTGSLFLSVFSQIFESKAQKAAADQFATDFPRGLPSNQETIRFRDEDAINWLMGELPQAPNPHFIYFHLLPPHEPYRPRKEFIGMFNGDKLTEVPKPLHPLGTTFNEASEAVTRRNYDEFLAYADAEFGRLYDFLDSQGILDTSYVIFTSDHGQILERGTKGHWNPLLYEPITHVPLIISAPGQSKRVNVTTPTSNVDLLPTLAHLVGQPIPTWSDGVLLPTFGGDAVSGRNIFTIEAKSNAKRAPLTHATIAMVKDNYKLLHYRGYDKGYDNHFELYDLANDPEELTDLYTGKPETASALQAELVNQLDAVNRPYEHV